METAALLPDALCVSDSKECPTEGKEVCEVASGENLPEEPESQEGASENLHASEKDEGETHTCETNKPSERVGEHTEKLSENSGVKHQTESATTETAGDLAAMGEGELLDFEDFNTDNVEKNVDGESADKKLSEKDKDEEDGACSEGELNDAEDLEEGELREPGSLSDTTGEPARQVCRFFHRGVCYYGNACRFLHTTNSQKGNYSMFETSAARLTHGFPNQQHSLGQRQPPERPRLCVPEFVQAAPIPFSPEESAWERGLKQARSLIQKANHLKKDPSFNQKKLSLSLAVNEKNIPRPDIQPGEIELSDKHGEEDFYTHKRERERGYETYGDPHIGGYNERREKDSRGENRQKRKLSVERRFPPHSNKGRNRNIAQRNTDMERPFFENYFDPWRRSKSPNRLSRERSPSHSFSSYSSYSRSSHTSGSRSPSSRSSCRSSRSPSVQQKRKVSPVPETAVSPKVSSNRFGPVKKKPGPSSSRSVSRGNSSRSRSISMDSVSSASSRNSTSSSGSEHEHEIKDLGEKSAVTNPDSAPLDKFRGIGSMLNSRDLLEEKFDSPVEMDLRYLIPKIPEKKEPVRLALTHKNPIKLTLLNKFPQSKAGFSKDSKEFAVKKPDEPLKLNLLQGVKRPLSPSESAEPVKQTPVLLPKKSASSRRDELLKQLKAVEDAIARKRAKF